MKTSVLLLGLLLSGYAQGDSVVYICDSGHAKRYHLRDDCRGLHNCTHHIVKISLGEAKRSGRTLCDFDGK